MKKTATKKLLILTLSSLLSLFGVLITGSSVSAYSFTHDITTTVDISAAQEAKVVQIHRLTWDNPTFYFPASKNYLYAYVFPAFQEQNATLSSHVRNVSVKSRYANPTKLSFTTTIVEGSYQIKVPYYEVLEKGTVLEFEISFVTDLYVLREGGLLEISYPGLNKDFRRKVNNKDGYDEITNYTVKFIIPNSQGNISNIFPRNGTKKTEKDKTTLIFYSDSLVDNAVRIIIGDKRLIKFELTGKTYATNTDAPNFVQDLLVNFIEIALPTSGDGTEASGQQVYYSKIEPFPTHIRTDSDGNILARIPISASKDGEIQIEGYAILTQKQVNESVITATIAEIPVNMKGYIAQEDRYWQVNNSNIQDIARKLVLERGNSYKQMRKTLTFVSQNLTYKKVENEGDLYRLGAVTALERKNGVCMEYADTLLTLLRAQGIPTRSVFGDGVGSRVDRTLKGIGHQWVGVWFPESGWIPVDPTWSDNEREYIGQDFDHFVWYVASKSVNEPSGFNCLSWDSQSPCKDALKINTSPVNQLPEVSSLMTLQEVQQQVLKNSSISNPFTSTLQNIVNYLGESKVGRVLFSRVGMLILFGLFFYSLLVVFVSTITKRIRAR